MPVKCEACLRTMTEERPVSHGNMPEGSVVTDDKYVEIDAIMERVHKDLLFRSRHGLAHNVHRIHSWFKFHGPWFPALPPKAQQAPPVATFDCYLWVGELCAFLAAKTWADEVHMDACAANREMPREMVRLGTH